MKSISRRKFVGMSAAAAAVAAAGLAGCSGGGSTGSVGSGTDSGNAEAVTPYSDGPQSIEEIAQKLCEGYDLEELSDDDKNYVIQMGYYNCDHMAAASVGEATGIYKLLGMNVDVTGTSNMPEAMSAGAMDCAYCSWTVSLNAANNGVPVFVAAENHTGGSEYLVASNDITEASQLVGKRISLGDNPETNNLNWVEWSKALGIPSDVNQYENYTMSDSDEYLALSTGDLDAYIACDPWGSMAEYSEVGHIMFTQDTDRPTGHGTCCKLAMNRTFADAHPKLAERICLAHTICIQFMYEHPFYAAQLFSAYYNVPVEVAIMTYWRKFVDEGRTIRWDLNEEYIENQLDTMREYHIRDDINQLDLLDYCDMTYMDNSGAKDFEQFIKDNIDSVFPEGMAYEDFKAKAMAVDGSEDYDTSQYEERNL